VQPKLMMVVAAAGCDDGVIAALFGAWPAM